MAVGIQRILWTILVGMAVGALGGFMVMSIIPPSDPLIWLGAVVVGAIFGAGAAVWVMVRYRRLARNG